MIYLSLFYKNQVYILMDIEEKDFFKFKANFKEIDLALVNYIYNKLHLLNRDKFPLNNLDKKLKLKKFCYLYYNKTYFFKDKKSKIFYEYFDFKLRESLFDRDILKFFNPTEKELKEKSLYLCNIIQIRVSKENLEKAYNIIKNMYNIRFSKKEYPDLDDLKIALYNNSYKDFNEKLIEEKNIA